MSKNSRVNYAQFVHKFTDKEGNIRFGVGQWNQERAQFTRPLDNRTRQLTGCSAEYFRAVEGLGGYLSREKALRRARYLFSYLFDKID